MTTGRQHLLRCSARSVEATQFHLAYLADSVLCTSQGLRAQPDVMDILLKICGLFKRNLTSASSRRENRAADASRWTNERKKEVKTMD